MEDIVKSREGRFPRGYELTVVVLLGLAFGFAYFDRMSITFLGPQVQADLGLSNEQLGWLGSGLSLTWALGAYFIGRWSDRIGRRKPFLLAALVVFSLCSVFSGMAWSFGSLLASRIVMGAAEGPFLPICLAIMVAASAESRRGLNAGIVQNVFGSLIGTALAPIVLTRLAEAYDWRTAFFLAGVPGLILAVLIWRYIAEPERPATQATEPLSLANELGVVRELLTSRNIQVCALVSVFAVGSIVAGSIFMPVYLNGTLGFNLVTVGNMMAVTGVCPAVGAVLAGLMSERFGRKPAMVLFTSLMVIAPAALLWIGGTAPATAPVLAGFMFVSWMGLGSFPLFMGVIPAETLGRARAATAMGLVVATGELVGGVLAAPLAGGLGDAYGLDAALYLQLGLAAMAGLTALFVVETNQRVLARRQGALAA
ncbi:MAG: MFS transporter [Alteraurantiacibacter sp.]